MLTPKDTAPPQVTTTEIQNTRQIFIDRILKTLQNPMDLQNLLNTVFPQKGELTEILLQLDELKQCLDSFRPLKPSQLKNLLESWDIEYTYESNRIEGNSLTLRETHLVVSKRMTIKGKSIDEHLEARNHQEAIYYIRDLSEQDTILNEYLINSIHNIILGGIEPRNAGKYRTGDVTISGATHIPPKPYILKKLMEDIFIWYNENKDTLHPVLLASSMHAKIVTVHPWSDGNGRTCRLIMNLILLQHGYPIARISGDDEARERYYLALDATQAEQSDTPFQMVIASYVRESLIEFLCMVADDSENPETGAYFFEKIKPFLPSA